MSRYLSPTPMCGSRHSVCFAWGAGARAQEMPRLVQDHGRATLMVDGAPFFLLGAQVDNSSGWPDRLNAVWPIAERLRLNTLEVPVYWEQMEPARGTLRLHRRRRRAPAGPRAPRPPRPALVRHLEERQDALRPRLGEVGHRHLPAHAARRRGEPIDVLSPNAPANLTADRPPSPP